MKVIDPVNLDSADPTLNVPDKQLNSPVESELVSDSLNKNKCVTQHSRRSGQSVPLILVADDDPMIRFLAQQALESRSFKVKLAEDGKEALELFVA